jgi:hypothetical protein
LKELEARIDAIPIEGKISIINVTFLHIFTITELVIDYQIVLNHVIIIIFRILLTIVPFTAIDLRLVFVVIIIKFNSGLNIPIDFKFIIAANGNFKITVFIIRTMISNQAPSKLIMTHFI